MRTPRTPAGALSYKAAAEYLGCCRQKLWELTEANEVRCFRPGAGKAGRFKGRQGLRVFFFRNDLDAYLQKTSNT